MTCLQVGAQRRRSPRHHSWTAHAPLRSPIRRAQPNRTALGGRTCNEQRHAPLMHHPNSVNNQAGQRQPSVQSTPFLTLRESFDSSAAALRDGAISAVDVRDQLLDEHVTPHSLLCFVSVPEAVQASEPVGPCCAREGYGDGCTVDARSIVRKIVVRQRPTIREDINGWRDRSCLHRSCNVRGHACAEKLTTWPAAVQVVHDRIAPVPAVQARRAPVGRAVIVARREINAITNRLIHRWTQKRLVGQAGWPRRAGGRTPCCSHHFLLRGAPAEASGADSGVQLCELSLLRLTLIRGSAHHVRGDCTHSACERTGHHSSSLAYTVRHSVLLAVGFAFAGSTSYCTCLAASSAAARPPGAVRVRGARPAGPERRVPCAGAAAGPAAECHRTASDPAAVGTGT